MKNYPRVCEKRIEELSSIKFNDEDNENLKNQINSCVVKVNLKTNLLKK